MKGSNAFDAYLPGANLILDPQAEAAVEERFKQIADYHEARRTALEENVPGVPYRPLPTDALYLSRSEWAALATNAIALSSFETAPGGGVAASMRACARGRDFAPERLDPKANLFDAAASHIRESQRAGRRR